MGILKYGKGIWVGGKRFFKRGRAKKTNGESRRREGARMQQLRLRLYNGEGTDVVVVIGNEGPDDVLVDDNLLPADHCLETISERLDPPIVNELPAYATFDDPPPSLPPIFNHEQKRIRCLVQNMTRSELVDTVILARAFHGICTFSCVGLTTDEIRERITNEFYRGR